MINASPGDASSIAKFPPEFMAAFIAELKIAITKIVRAAHAKVNDLSSPPPLAKSDPARGPIPYRRRKAEALVAQALRDGVKLEMGDAHDLLDQYGAIKFARRASGTKQAAEKAFAYCEAQRDLHRRQVPFRDAYAYYLGYRAEAP